MLFLPGCFAEANRFRFVSEPSEISEMVFFQKIVNGIQSLIILLKAPSLMFYGIPNTPIDFVFINAKKVKA